jgi:hypothetical protein
VAAELGLVFPPDVIEKANTIIANGKLVKP